MPDRSKQLGTPAKAGTSAKGSAGGVVQSAALAKNKALIQRLVAVGWGAHDAAVAETIVAPDIVDHAAFPGQPPGLKGYLMGQSIIAQCAPNLQYGVDVQIAEGDLVMTRWTARGTNTGTFFGIPPSGKAIQVSGITVNRIANGRIVEQWTSWDNLGLLQQVGVIPERVVPHPAFPPG
jgi:steroid delta-isomerase-like uncharacterized protein